MARSRCSCDGDRDATAPTTSSPARTHTAATTVTTTRLGFIAAIFSINMAANEAVRPALSSSSSSSLSSPSATVPSWELFVPGRLCLFGEHTDWAAVYAEREPSIPPGLALVTGTTQGHSATVRATPAATLVYRVPWHAEVAASEGAVTWPLDKAMLAAEAQAGGFFSYVAGTALVVLERHGDAVARAGHGVEILNHTTTLPVRKGLSSSAAVCVLTARALSCAFALGLSVADEMELAYQGEIRTPSRCGRLDQACAFGPRPSLLEFRGRTLTATAVALQPGAPSLHLIIVDLAAGKDTKEILRRLNDCYPVASTPLQHAVHRFLGATSPQLTLVALEAVQRGDARALGTLMLASQALFDRDVAPACPQQLTAPVLHALLAHPPLQPFIYGGKGVGSQGDGTAQLVARDRDAQAQAIAVIARDFPRMHCLPLTLQP
jgi:galactokinase